MSLPPPLLVANAASFHTLLAALTQAPAFAVDTESNSLFVYRERVCLLQFSTPTEDFILDPLRALDLSALGPLFANPAQQKVFHAAEYDILCLKRDYGFEFANLFDTMVAARTLGRAHIGLAALLEEHFEVKLNKKFQRADWGHRPLTRELLDYARLDTHYLLRLRDALTTELEEQQRLTEAHEEFQRLVRLKAALPAPAPDFWGVSGARDLLPTQASILRELHHYRDHQAQRLNRPPFKILSDQTLIAITKQSPTQLADLATLPGMTAGQIERHGVHVIHAVQRGLAAPPTHPPRPHREPEDVRERYDRLHLWRKQTAQARGVESDVILPREALWELARRAPSTPEDLHTLEHLGPWRRETYGAAILKTLTET